MYKAQLTHVYNDKFDRSWLFHKSFNDKYELLSYFIHRGYVENDSRIYDERFELYSINPKDNKSVTLLSIMEESERMY